ncbi:MAG TPA: hypothetical protein PK620_13365 [Denitromonas sp.]|uniref:hypothetical protein n=1 Tax=Denitromonas sp. TaxID=2734609 RepID=UPI001D76A359|nr:hypothetical protein [Rhodocyclaceae bacterium]MCP5222251.1 hypothetical protein [Zoogloeaceae bacterium]HPR06154.1 hypothetical protein [Denitromonas sp.]HQU88907.1 hypothetical protein [Denitromonas sp.]HQV15902.1 hypothetical protein [Denitromonas sp.]
MKTKNIVAGLVATLALTAGLVGPASAEGEYEIHHYKAPPALQDHAKTDDSVKATKDVVMFNSHIGGY